MKRFLLWLVLFVLIGAAVAKIWIFEIVKVTGDDMAPSLQAGDSLLARKVSIELRRGDLVLLEHPRDQRLVLRRVVGLPGDKIAVTGEVLRVNGKRVARREQREVVLKDSAGPNGRELKLKLLEEELEGASYQVLKDPSRRSKDYPEKELGDVYFVLSDNRNHGSDSRGFGPVPLTKIRALVTNRISAGAGSLKGEPAREGWVSFR